MERNEHGHRAAEVPDELRPLVEHVLQAIGTPLESFPVKHPSPDEGWNQAARWLEKYHALENGVRDLILAMGVPPRAVLEASARALPPGFERPGGQP